MLSKDIRKKFFSFFVAHGHEKVDSSSLIPAQDPTLLFTNAGMNQFKDLFLGKEKRNYTRAVTIQKCMRAGGKHNDLDNVGFTKRHLTFFEMMGNFSFGDYFKKDAIRYAWDFLTKDLGLKKENLWVSIFRDDNESFEIWNKNIGVDASRIVRLGEKDNFWQMGDVGPCGPCTEIYVDRGADLGCKTKDCKPGCDCERFLEIWNNVFMQFDRQADGALLPLKQTGVDTGMGLERITSILQNKDSVYETDLFMPIIQKIEKLTGLKYYDQEMQKRAAFNVLADHIRASTFLIADGCSPSNEGRGYVLRKIIRRAALFERKISEKSIFAELVDVVVDEMGEFYPELKTNKALIKNILNSEIEKFYSNLIRGTNLLEAFMAKNKSSKQIPGVEVFKLYDTYGFPVEVTELIASEHDFSVDRSEFEKEMEKQRALSGKKMVKTEKELELPENIQTKFVGYQVTENKSQLIAIINANDQLVDNAKKGDSIWIVTSETPFFVACGGQVDDTGFVEINGNKADVLALKKIDNAIAVKISAPTDLKVGTEIKSVVDKQIRLDTMNNHTATHLLQSALIDLLGKQVKQSGSVVTPDYLRFDFTYHENLTLEQIKQVENIVNTKIRENIATEIFETNYKDAVNQGVIAIFGEKYNPESVRVVKVPGFSAELCGGTHVKRTGDIGAFKITEVSALSAGNRRIFALTGPKAIELFQQNFNDIKTLSQEFRVKPEEVVSAVEKQKAVIKDLTTQLNVIKKHVINLNFPEWLKNIKAQNGSNYLVIELENFDGSEIKKIAEDLAAKKESIVFVLNKMVDKVGFVCIVPEKYLAKVDIKNLALELNKLGLKGGASKNSIQGGGNLIEAKKIEETLKSLL